MLDPKDLNSPEDMAAFKAIVVAGGKILCHPSQWIAIRTMAKRDGLPDVFVNKILSSHFVGIGCVLAVDSNHPDGKRQIIKFQEA